MKVLLIIATLFVFSMPANAAMFVSVEDRAEAIDEQLKGNNSYDAHLARALSMLATDEKDQHDLNAALQFIKMAEEHASRAGGVK